MFVRRCGNQPVFAVDRECSCRGQPEGRQLPKNPDFRRQHDANRIPGLDDFAQGVEFPFFRAEDQVPLRRIGAVAGDDPATPCAVVAFLDVEKDCDGFLGDGGFGAWAVELQRDYLAGFWLLVSGETSTLPLPGGRSALPVCPGVRVRERWQAMAQGVQGSNCRPGKSQHPVAKPRNRSSKTPIQSNRIETARIKIALRDRMEAAGDFFRGFQFAHVVCPEVSCWAW